MTARSRLSPRQFVASGFVAALSLLSGVVFDVIARRLLRYKYV